MTSPPRILRLQDDVIAQVKSSSVITDLKDVVMGLLRNALDACATRIDISVDALRKSCSVEDNGHGIALDEFLPEGGLAKSYCTSKSQRHDAYGSRGSFLNDVAALSLLTIISKNVENHWPNQLTLHMGKVVARHTPAPASSQLALGNHGTKVIARNIFSNIPVRARHRSFTENFISIEHEWNDFVLCVIGLLIACDSYPTVTLVEEKTSRRLTFRDTTTKNWEDPSHSSSLRHAHGKCLNLLMQGQIISRDSRPSWVPITGGEMEVRITGAISLDPAPTQNIQFISIGKEPLTRTSRHSELYSLINAEFDSSRFGSLEEGIDHLSNAELEKRRTDKRFKQEGLTLKQARFGRKGTDRWPQFYLRIDFVSTSCRPWVTDSCDQNQDCHLEAITHLLMTMVDAWLRTYHFRVRKSLKKAEAREGFAETRKSVEQDASSVLQNTSRKRKFSSSRPASSPSIPTPELVLSTWTRARGSRFFVVPRPDSADPGPRVIDEVDGSIESRLNEKEPATSIVEPLEISQIFLTSRSSAMDEKGMKLQNVEGTSDGHVESLPAGDAIMNNNLSAWIDPTTKQTFFFDKISGTFAPGQSLKPESSAEKGSISAQTNLNKIATFGFPLKQPSKSKTLDKGAKALESVLKEWINPVFPLSETTWAEQDYELSNMYSSCEHNGSLSQKFSKASFKPTQITSQSMIGAEVISQVDNKFILIIVETNAYRALSPQTLQKTVLVLVDQHAADERCKVESLCKSLCTPMYKTDGILRSNLGLTPLVKSILLSKRISFDTRPADGERIRRRAKYFSEWGILFDCLEQKQLGYKFEVFALPPAIAERCCIETQTLIDMIRTEAWEDSRLQNTTENIVSEVDQSTKIDNGWLTKIGRCPRGILEMLNSRSCRSAIMFNDPLSLEDCKALIKEVAHCAFPFQCAHGRPSMVPLFDIIPDRLGHASSKIKDREGNYIQNFRRWQDKISECQDNKE